VWVPRFYEVTVRRHRKVEGIHEFFPRYLFAGIAQRSQAGRLFRCEHVTDVLGADAPLAIPAAVLQVLADRMTGNVKSERLAAAAAFRVGEMRTVKDGPFASFLAEITELLANGRIKGDVHIFGRKTPVEFEPGYLEAV
jgi:transcription antitermination factor NusG